MRRHPASFRDPSGYIFRENEKIHRCILPPFFTEYAKAKAAGIYEQLWKKNWLVRHQEVRRSDEEIILEVETIHFISYPYEWSFEQYKMAARLTLKLQIWLLENGFGLKDASAFNIVFKNNRPLLIDTLSIEPYEVNAPWRALKQFNHHFLAPLVKASYHGAGQLKLLQNNLDGEPLLTTSRQLPLKSYLRPTIYGHIHMLAKAEKKVTQKDRKAVKPSLKPRAQIKMLNGLDAFISKLKVKDKTEWQDYYDQTNYTQQAFVLKKDITKDWCQEIEAQRVVDYGGNDGTFSRCLPDQVKQILTLDIDPAAVDSNYRQCLEDKDDRIYPIVQDIAQPSAALGLNNMERESFWDRLHKLGPDTGLALALIHHLTLSANIPFQVSAEMFAKHTQYLIMEFPDKQDSWVQYILDSKRDARHLFEWYGYDAFAKAYKQHFNILKEQRISGTERTLFLMESKDWNAG